MAASREEILAGRRPRLACHFLLTVNMSEKIPSQERQRTDLPVAQLVRRSRAHAFKFPAKPSGGPRETNIHSDTFGDIDKS